MSATVLQFRPMTTHLESYPNRIRELRTARNLSQAQLGELIGITPIHVGHLELGRRELKLPLMRAIARALRVTLAELLNEEDNPLASSPRARRLLTNWHDADEPGRQAIERVAESFVPYKGAAPADITPERLAPRDAETTGDHARRKG